MSNFSIKGELGSNPAREGAIFAPEFLVLGAHLGTVKATDDVRVASVRLISSVVSSFGWHNLIIINTRNTPFLSST